MRSSSRGKAAAARGVPDGRPAERAAQRAAQRAAREREQTAAAVEASVAAAAAAEATTTTTDEVTDMLGPAAAPAAAPGEVTDEEADAAAADLETEADALRSQSSRTYVWRGGREEDADAGQTSATEMAAFTNAALQRASRWERVNGPRRFGRDHAGSAGDDGDDDTDTRGSVGSGWSGIGRRRPKKPWALIREPWRTKDDGIDEEVARIAARAEAREAKKRQAAAARAAALATRAATLEGGGNHRAVEGGNGNHGWEGGSGVDPGAAERWRREDEKRREGCTARQRKGMELGALVPSVAGKNAASARRALERLPARLPLRLARRNLTASDLFLHQLNLEENDMAGSVVERARLPGSFGDILAVLNGSNVGIEGENTARGAARRLAATRTNGRRDPADASVDEVDWSRYDVDPDEEEEDVGRRVGRVDVTTRADKMTTRGDDFNETRAGRLGETRVGDRSAGGRLKRCVIVGNGGGLAQRPLGSVIDRHSFVVRLNQGPTHGYHRAVGKRTDVRVLNALWASRYGRPEVRLSSRGGLSAGRDVGVDAETFHTNWSEREIPLERGTLVLCARTVKGSDACPQAEASFARRRHDVGLLYLAPRVVSATRHLLDAYRSMLCAPGEGSVPSTGLVAVFIFMNVCERLTVTGFGAGTRGAPYHYFDGVGARDAGNPVHGWTTEAALLHALARLGRVVLLTAEGCVAKSAAQCEGLGGGGAAAWLPPEHDADEARHYLPGSRGGVGVKALAGRVMDVLRGAREQNGHGRGGNLANHAGAAQGRERAPSQRTGGAGGGRGHREAREEVTLTFDAEGGVVEEAATRS